MTATMVAAPSKFATVPRLYPGGTVVCLASGPSLTREDVEYCRTRVDGAVAVNNSYQLAPWATALYAADTLWWQWHKGAPGFKGLKYTVTRSTTQQFRDVQLLRKSGDEGLDLKPDALRMGRNSGYQALNLAVHFGAKTIILLGYDMQRGPKDEAHWHGEHPNYSRSPFKIFIQKFDTIVKPLEQAGIRVINCTRSTALHCFPEQPLEEALP